ncbi:MAG: NADH-quinone oxidoreductase subunit H [Candidatus Omnitrophica bacterium]|nr:NADH-quinone oxidoreductase subunit H [Candidatus Omnitrophota bacterium]
MTLLFNYLIFPGLLFSAVIGLLAGWFDRKLSARVQFRVGPPWHQNFTDIIKLLGKETIYPAQSKFTFLFSPYLGFLSAGLVATILGMNLRSSASGFNGDLIVVIYLMLIPAIAMILGASASRNPLASVGASRELKLILAYELPFVLSIVALIIKCGGSIQLGKILELQALGASNIASWSGALAFIVCFFCMQAKLGYPPFDIAEADQELMCGTLIEYSGLPLAVFKLTKAVMLYILPVFLIILFMGKDTSLLFMVLKYIGLLFFIVLVKNTNPRVRIDQALGFFWKVPTFMAVASVILALVGQ